MSKKYEKVGEDTFVYEDYFKNDDFLTDRYDEIGADEMEGLTSHGYLCYDLHKNNFKNRSIKKLRIFANSIVNTLSGSSSLKKTSGKGHVLGKSRGKHASR